VNALAIIAALVGVLAAGVIYGTDVFCALVQRPALAQLDDVTMTAAMGRVHQYGDRRLPAPGVIGILAAVTATAAAAAIAHVTPGNARALQLRWDSITTARALLMAAAVAGLATSAATH
jgi:hypothetical protein